MSTFSFYNTLGREKQVFEPIDAAHVKIYACGPTVYDYAHIGNARMAVVCDQMVRVLRSIYPKVTYVSNITDVDDKIIASAREKNIAIDELTEKFAAIYNQDMLSLGVALPDLQPKATEHIRDMIQMIEYLVERGAAYVNAGHVLFRVACMNQYGVLSGRNPEELLAGARIEVNAIKKDPGDFVLWKPDDDLGWDSPWGKGRPGWHIECSAMSWQTLGFPFDIHAGGGDLVFPHHENEIAQSCAAFGSQDPASYARYWFHNGFVMLDGEKMSKSLGNILLVHDLVDAHPGEVVRLALLSSHYRSPLNWSDHLLSTHQVTMDRLYRLKRELGSDVGQVLPKISEALQDDLNTPLAISLLVSAMKEVSKISDQSNQKRLWADVLASAQFMGLGMLAINEWFSDVNSDELAIIEQMVRKRDLARAERDFATADRLRDELLAMGVELEDAPTGTKWSKN